jgi:hypothetical protein
MTTVALPRPAPRLVSRFRYLLGSLAAPELLVWALFILLSPFYVMPNGRPQPADFISMAVLPLLLRGERIRLQGHWRGAVFALLAFCAYVVAVNSVWGVLLLDRRATNLGTINFILFYVFNTYIFVACVFLYLRHRSKFITVTLWATVTAVCIQLILLGMRGGDGYRESLYFNNPNQLGYYTLLAASMIAMGYSRARIPWWIAGIALAGAALMAALSLSRGAIFGLIFVALAAALRRPALLVVAAVALLIGTNLRDPSELARKIDDRLAGMGTKDDDTLEGRGFARISMHPEYLVLGAGEVGHDRYGSFSGELHSSWGTVLFSYGVVGMVLFLRFLWRTLRCLRWSDLLFLAPTAFYGMTHNGLRFRFFWVFLGVAGIIAYHVAMQRRLHAGARQAPARAHAPVAATNRYQDRVRRRLSGRPYSRTS